MTLNEAKEKCADVLEKVTKLYAEKSERIITKDIELYMQAHSEIVTKTGSDYYIVDNRVKMYVSNGCLEIVDRRGTAFAWGFEIDSDLYRGNIIFVNGRPEVIEYVRDESLVGTIEDAIEKLEKTSEFLKREDITKYKYYSAHEDISAETFEQVLEIVLKRKPIVC